MQKGQNMANSEDIKELTAKIEEAKIVFDTFKHEHNTRFTKLHERRFEVIEEIFTKLSLVHLYSIQYTAHVKIIYGDADQEEKERAKKIQDGYNDLKSYWIGKDIYFKEDIIQKINKILADIRSNVQTYANSQKFKFNEQSMKDAKEADAYLVAEIPELLKALKDEFQLILGTDLNISSAITNI